MAPGARFRSAIVFRLAVAIVSLALLVAGQRRLAVLFDDGIAALFVALTVAVTVVGMVKPVVTPGRRR